MEAALLGGGSTCADEGGSSSPPFKFDIPTGAVIAAPMVRVSTLAFRLVCAANGADLCFTEEIVAQRLAKSVREEVTFPCAADPNFRHGVEFVVYEPRGSEVCKRVVVFSTILPPARELSSLSSPHRRCSFAEGAPVVLHLGVANGADAAAAALRACDVVDGIDVNMGCPKKFSVQNGMGAALMRDPQRSAEILSSIHAAVNSPPSLVAQRGFRIPISLKTRVSADPEASVRHISVCVASCPSLRCITLHARRCEQRSDTPPLYHAAVEIAAKVKRMFPWLIVVFNGSIRCRAEAAGLLAKERSCGVFDGCMIARGAMWDPFAAFSHISPHQPPLSDPMWWASTASSPSSPTATDDDALSASSAPYQPLPSTAASYTQHFGQLLCEYRAFRNSFSFVKFHLARVLVECDRDNPQLKRLFCTLQEAKFYDEFAVAFHLPQDVFDRMFREVSTDADTMRADGVQLPPGLVDGGLWKKMPKVRPPPPKKRQRPEGEGEIDSPAEA